MAFTMKQQRNGADMGADGHNSAVANEGPVPVIPVAAAQAAGAAYSDQGRQVFDGGGLGGSMTVDWDDGLAVSEMPGEA